MTASLDSWFAVQLARLWGSAPSDSGGLLLGCPVWGEDYIDRFARFCLPSLMAPANQQALRERTARLMLYTDADSVQPLLHATAALERAGLRVQFRAMPSEVMTGVDGNHKYRLLAATQSLALLEARAAGEAFHPLHPDVLYSERYFEAASRLGAVHGAIVHGNVWVDIFSAEREIETYRREEAIVMPAPALGGMGLRRLHREHQPSLIGPGVALPRSHILMWPGRDALHHACPHMNPVWLSARLVAAAPVLFPITLDAELPNLIGESCHVPAPSDEMVLVELADDKAASGKLGDLQSWTRLAWSQMVYSASFLPIFRRRTVIPLDQPNPAGLDEAEIERHHAALLDALLASRVDAMDSWFIEAGRQRRPYFRPA